MEEIRIVRVTDGTVEGQKWVQFQKSFADATEEGTVSLASTMNMGWGAVPSKAKIGDLLAKGEACQAYERTQVVMKKDGKIIPNPDPEKAAQNIPAWTWRIQGLGAKKGQSIEVLDQNAKAMAIQDDAKGDAQAKVLADAEGVS